MLLGCKIIPGKCADGLTPTGRRRVAKTLELAFLYPKATIWVAGGKRWRGEKEAWLLGRALVAGGISPRRIRLECWSQSTWENAQFASLSPRDMGVVVTSGWHVRRALVAFRAHGHEVKGVAADGWNAGTRTYRRALVRLGKERLGSVWYRLRAQLWPPNAPTSEDQLSPAHCFGNEGRA